MRSSSMIIVSSFDYDHEIMRSIRDNNSNYIVSDFSIALMWNAFKTKNYQLYPE